MTMTRIIPNTRERQARISALWERRPELKFDQVAAEVDAQMAAELMEQAEQEAKTRALTASFSRMFVCPCCGDGNTMGSRDGLCGPCGQTSSIIRAERAAEENVQGHRRRALVEAWLDR
jgi:hypothetical protein